MADDPKFVMEPHTHADKSFLIYNGKIELAVNYDDVDYEMVDAEAERVLRLLNS